MKKLQFATLLIAFSIQALSAQKALPVLEFKNGNWYDGQGFTTATWYVSAGKLTQKAPVKIDSVIDLSGKWVVPPMADAYCASVADNSTGINQLANYFSEGIYYLQILNNTQEGRQKVADKTNKPDAPDVVFANGGITCTLGLPFLKYESVAQGIRNPQLISQRYDEIKQGRKMLGNAYWFVDNKDALDKNWDKIKAQKPGMISIYLLDAQNNGGKEGKGLNPEVAKAVIKKAHKSDLRVYAHVETAEDVRLALKLGADGIANLPGYNWDGSGDAQKYELNDDDLKKLAKKKTPVVPLLSHAQGLKSRPGGNDAQSKLLKRLLDNGVNVVIGSNDSQRTTRTELNYWFQLGNMDYNTVLKILCENTPRAVFPDRKIGKIAEGYEASFLVLGDNPTSNILKIRVIDQKVKNGVLLR